MTIDRRQFVGAGLGLAATLGSRSDASGQSIEREYRSADVVVIGAGLFGSAAARYLSADGAKVVLVGPGEPAERLSHDGAFASHHDASRLVRGVDPELIWATLAKRSIARYRELERDSGTGFYNEIGYMMVTPGGLGEDWFNLPAMREVAADMDVRIENLDGAALSNRYPFLAFTPGSSAVLQTDGAGYIDPRGLLAAQQRIAASKGALLLRDEAVSLDKHTGQWRVMLASGEEIRSHKVLVATGAYTGVAGLLPRRLEFLVRAAMIMEAEVAPDSPATYPTTLYAKTDGEEDFWGLLMPPIRYADGRTILKTMDGYYGPAPLEGQPAIRDWMLSDGHADHHETLRRALREVYPSLAVRSTRFRPCLIADTPSRYPYIDMLDDGLGVVAGGNGKSAKSSDEIGRLAARMIRRGSWDSSLPHSVFAARYT